MKQHTEQFKINIKEQGRQLKHIITYGQDTLEQELYSISPHYEGNILKSVMKELEVESSVDIPLNTEINYQFGVLVGNDYEFLDFGQYIVYKSEKQEDSGTYLLTCCDKMLYAMKEYESVGVTYPINVRDYLSVICDYLGIGFASVDTAFANWNKIIPNEKYLDASGNSLGYTFRDVLDELAQVTASTICINQNDELEVRYINNTLDTIDEQYLKDVNVNFGEKYGPVNSIVLSRSGGADNVFLRDETSVAQNGLCEIKIIDNQIMNDNNRSEYLVDILAKLNGLEYYINDFSSIGVFYYELCDRYNIQVENNTYNCIMLNDEINFEGGAEEHIHTDLLEESETDYEKADKTDRRINQTYLLVDKQNQIIQSVVTNVNAQNSKISQITQTVDELESKIQDISDITTAGETSYASLILTGINESEPIEVRIRPINTSISYLYPKASGLYPDDLLFMPDRKLRFTNTNTSEIFDYILPDDLLYYDSEHYDEFYLNYDSQTCQVTKRCTYDANGDVILLANEVITDYTYPLIQLTDGDYQIEILGYEFGYLAVRLMASNIYTSQFATKVEMTSAINQKANEINLVVNQKVDNRDYTHASIVAKINDDTSQVQIEADKVDINANDVINILAGNTLNLTSKNISINSNNFKVTSQGNLTATNANISGTITSNNANITGGSLTLAGNYVDGTSQSNLKIQSPNSSSLMYSNSNRLNGNGVNIIAQVTESSSGVGNLIINNNLGDSISLNVFNDTSNSATIAVSGGGSNSYVTSNSVISAQFINNSKESQKKNIQKYEQKAIELVKNSEIYEYQYKSENDEDKKHIGFVIGDLGGEYKTPEEVIAKDKNGIDNYTMISILWKAVQEQQEQIEELQKEINKLKGEK